ncbi:hypothetical protein HZH68_003516 [Vespula germanica]|uniref:Uncharacterized protein n=2 Tax=Vespula TaxID=7451 RepID=A0A834NPF0_VESGE|nr:hypothetical protein HZH68_003516 [Vespula germanica]KAF7435711.1 hypothetical protein H0235_003902 [Vespula pensylvanica]
MVARFAKKEAATRNWPSNVVTGFVRRNRGAWEKQSLWSLADGGGGGGGGDGYGGDGYGGDGSSGSCKQSIP